MAKVEGLMHTAPAMLQEQSKKVQQSPEQDWGRDAVDYHVYRHAPSGLAFRGPAPALGLAGSYVVCLGADQTFGRCCETPYPKLLEQWLGLPVVNFGYCGASASFFLGQPALLAVARKARYVIVQVMSGRSQRNSLYDSEGLDYVTRRADGERLSAAQAYQAVLDTADAESLLPQKLRKSLRRVFGPREVRDLLWETRQNWVNSYHQLLAEITAPKTLLWFSRRPPGHFRGTGRFRGWQRYDSVHSVFGDYPQLVTAGMVRGIRPGAESYVQCVAARGRSLSPSTWSAGGSGAENTPGDSFCPSSEMHQDVARALLKDLPGWVRANYPRPARLRRCV